MADSTRVVLISEVCPVTDSGSLIKRKRSQPSDGDMRDGLDIP